MATEVLLIIIGAFAVMQIGFAITAISASRHRRRVAEMERVRLKVIELRAHLHTLTNSEQIDINKKEFAMYMDWLPTLLNRGIQQSYPTRIFDGIYFANTLGAGIVQEILRVVQNKCQEFSKQDGEEISKEDRVHFYISYLAIGVILEMMSVTPTLRAVMLRMVIGSAARLAAIFSSKTVAMRLRLNVVKSILEKEHIPNFPIDNILKNFVTVR
jgi:hypothetical protein